MAATYRGEVPRHLVRRIGPSAVQHAVERESLRIESRVLTVRVPDAVTDCIHQRERVHRLPEEVAGIEIDAEVGAKMAGAGEGLEVEGVCNRVKLEADQAGGMVARREVQEIDAIR